MAASGVDRPFVGRLEVLDTLRRRRDLARDGRGGVTLVEGNAGVGKSKLIEQLTHEARAKGLRVVLMRTPALESPPPLQLLRSVLTQAKEPDERTDEDEAGSGFLGLVSPPSSEPYLLGFVAGADRTGIDPNDRLLEVVSQPVESADQGKVRLFAQLAEEFLALARGGAMLVVIEDLHLADEASLDALGSIAPRLPDRPLWLVATSLPVATLREPQRSLIERILRSGGGELVPLRPFTAGETLDFVRGLDVGGNAAVEDVTRWHSQSGGNPQFLEQLIRTRASGATEAGTTGDEAPGELSEYLARRLPALDEESRRVLTVGAVLGREFSFDLLLSASEDDEEKLTEVLERLVRMGALRERPNEHLEFVRDDLRGYIYAGLTEAHRRVLHKKAGEALEAMGPADPSTVFALARHFSLGRIEDRAELYNRFAADFAMRSMSANVARFHLERALEAHRRARPNDHAGEIEIVLDLAVQMDRLGELKPAERLLRELDEGPHLMHAASPAQRALLKIYLARILTDQGRWDEADRWTNELLGSADVAAAAETRIAAHRLRGEVLYYRGEYAESLRHHDLALATARELGRRREIALEMVRRANVLGMIPGRLEEAVADYRTGVAELRELGDDAEAAYALVYLGVVVAQHGHLDESIVALHEAVGLAERAHDLRRVGWALFNIGDVERERGNLPEAEAATNRAREILERIGDRFGLAQTYITEAKIRRDRREFVEAERPLLEAYRIVRELRVRADELEVVLRLAEVALGRGDLATAKTRAAQLAQEEVARFRPDLADDYRRLLAAIGEAGGPAP
ncbi:MAG: tetratricopeptide repeat protein [Thermoplasmata archaeon]|nr:tetratricopeptide repeat protein [Thermoplasmata archaeon]